MKCCAPDLDAFVAFTFVLKSLGFDRRVAWELAWEAPLVCGCDDCDPHGQYDGVAH